MKLPLHENERVVIKTREHSRVLLQPFAAFLVFTAACAFALGYLTRERLPGWLAPNTEVLSWLCLLLWLLLVLIWCAAPLVRWARGLIVLTTERILFRTPSSRGRLQSVGLYGVRDLVAHTRTKAPGHRPGTLDVLLHQGYVRISNIPAVGYFRDLAIQMMTQLGGNRQVAGHGKPVAGEGDDR